MSLNLGTLGQVLIEATMSYNPEIETRLRSYEDQEGYVGSLLQILGTPNVPVPTRMAAAIRFRKAILAKWPLIPGRIDRLSVDDRATVHEHIVPAILAEANPNIQNLLISTILTLARQDYPGTWNTQAVNPICNVLQQQQQSVTNPPQLFGALSCLYQLMKVRRASLNVAAERNAQSELVSNTAGPMLSILFSLLQQEDQCIQHGDEATIFSFFSISHIIYKIISLSFFQLTLPYYKNPQNVNNVTQCLIQGIKSAQPAFSMKLYQRDGERCFSHPIFKRRKWAFRTIARLLSESLRVNEIIKDGNGKKITNKPLALEQVKWNHAWTKGFSEVVLDAALNALFQLTIPGYQLSPLAPGSAPPTILPNGVSYRPILTPRLCQPLLRILLKFINLKVAKGKKSLFKLYFAPNLRPILQAIHSVYTFQAYDVDQLQNNPTVFVESILARGLVEGVNDPFTTCDEIVKALFIKRNLYTQLYVEELINKPLQQYSAYMSNPGVHTPEQSLQAVLHKDASIRIFGLNTIFNAPIHIANSLKLLQQLNQDHLAKPFAAYSDLPLLEIRALWCVQRYSKDILMAMKGRLISPQKEPLHVDLARSIALTAAQAATSAVTSDDASKSKGAFAGLKIQAAATLDELFNIEEVRVAVLPYAAQLFSATLAMLEESDTESVSVLFQRLLFHYREEVVPFAETILVRIVAKFTELHADADVGSGDRIIIDENGNPQIEFTDDDFDDDDDGSEAMAKFYAATSLLTSMHTVLTALGEADVDLASAERHIIPICHMILSAQETDFVQELLVIVQNLGYFSKGVISDEAWSLFGPIMGMLIHGWGSSDSTEALPCLVNYFSKPGHYTRVVQFTEADGKTVTQCSPLDLLLRYIWEQFDSPHYMAYQWQLQENAIHLLRSYVAWLPTESEINQPTHPFRMPHHEQFIQQAVTQFTPKLVTQILYALQIVIHPDAMKRHQDEINNALAKTQDEAERQALIKSPVKLPMRKKYTTLIVDTLFALLFKYPTTMIPYLCATPAPAEAQAVKNDPQMTLLHFILDACHEEISSSQRAGSIHFHIVGLSTLLQWFASPHSNCDHHVGSILRTNIIANLLSSMHQFRLLDDIDEDEDDEEDNREWEDEGGLEDDDDFDINEAGDDDDDGEAANAELQRMEKDQHKYMELAAAYQLTQISDVYYNDNEFVSPIDHINIYELFLAALGSWVQTSSQFQQRSQQESGLLTVMTNMNGQDYIERFKPIIDWAKDEKEAFAQELLDDQAEFDARYANK